MPGIHVSGEGHAETKPPGIKLTHLKVDSRPSTSPFYLKFSLQPCVKSIVSSNYEGILAFREVKNLPRTTSQKFSEPECAPQHSMASALSS